MAEKFPDGLPGVLLATYANTEQSAVRHDESEIGPPSYQLLSLDVPTIFNVRWNFYPIDFQLFEGWWLNSLNKNSNSFTIDLPVGKGTENMECNFVDTYTASRSGKKIIVNAQLRVIDKPYDDQETFDDLLVWFEFLAPGTEDRDNGAVLTKFLQFSNVDLPDAWDDINYGTTHAV